MIVLPGEPSLALVAPDLTPTQAAWLCAIAWLQEQGPVTCRKLTNYFGYSPGAATSKVGPMQALKKKGYITTERSGKINSPGTIRLSRPLKWRELAS